MSATSARHSHFDDIQGILTGALVVAVGLTFIKQAGLLTGGAVGLTFLIHYSTEANFGLTLFLINIPFYWLGIKRMGLEFTLKTLATVFIVALLTETLPLVLDIAHIDPFFAGLCGGLLMGVGMLILFRHRASLGGFNVLVLYLQERFGWSAGKLQMGLDVAILLAGTLLVPPLVLAASVLGAVLLNFALAVNHKPGRYMAF
ncbi:MAG: YitT family protein [Rhodocyclaceae bacterium]|nr:YitT family protein [Rhodocyclaceae bacterium]